MRTSEKHYHAHEFARRIVAFLALGAILNVAVAWGCAMLIQLDWRQRSGRDHYTNWGDYNDGFGGYTATRYRRVGTVRISVFYSSFYEGSPERNTTTFPELIPSWATEFTNVPEIVGRERKFLDEVETHLSVVDARGWPCLALWGGMKIPSLGNYSVDGKPVQLMELRYWILPLAKRTTNTTYADFRWLPLRPIWPGFALNTLFYAAILWLLLGAPGFIRRRVRRKRGLCPVCAYDLRGSDSHTCPECGTPISASSIIQEGAIV